MVYDLSCAFGFDLGFERLEMICAWEFDFFGEGLVRKFWWFGVVWRRGRGLAMNEFCAAAERQRTHLCAGMISRVALAGGRRC
jgi:hypothetical protein